MARKTLTFIAIILCICLLSNNVNAETTSIVFQKNKSETKKIALTFDDGPHPRYTPQILNILKKYNVKATFFVIGKNIENYPSTLKRIYEEGHEIGNHSYDHSNVSTMSKNDIKYEIDKCEQLIKEQLNFTPKLFRPPQGKLNASVEAVSSSLGYYIILWSIDTRDWEHNDPNNIMNTVQRNVKGGDIILMHDYISGKNTTCDALELMIPALQKQGYKFVTVSELINAK